MRLTIKNMVCDRCILVVKQELEKLGVAPQSIRLGEVELQSPLSKSQLSVLETNLNRLGFEVLDDEKQRIIEKIKTVIIELIHHNLEDNHHKYSELLSQSLKRDYSYLSSLFSQVEGVTIEKYIINQKIERVKELIIYNQLSLSEIAYQTGYSSVAHLSNQFKKVTGLTPTYFKQVGLNRRKPLDQV